MSLEIVVGGVVHREISRRSVAHREHGRCAIFVISFARGLDFLFRFKKRSNEPINPLVWEERKRVICPNSHVITRVFLLKKLYMFKAI